MNALFILIPISLLLLIVAIASFVYAVKKGQFEDLDSASIDILREQDSIDQHDQTPL